jgi:hypothetical protein
MTDTIFRIHVDGVPHGRPYNKLGFAKGVVTTKKQTFKNKQIMIVEYVPASSWVLFNGEVWVNTERGVK